jgi:hypothetical protein
VEEVCLDYARNRLHEQKNDQKKGRWSKFPSLWVVSTRFSYNHQISIAHFFANLPLTDKIVLPYTSTSKKQHLINQYNYNLIIATPAYVQLAATHIGIRFDNDIMPEFRRR